MQTLIETLNLYNNAFDALCEAQNLVGQLKKEASRILKNNTEPIIVLTSRSTAREITTPNDLRDLTEGTVISVGGSEYMRTGYTHGPWADFLGNKRSHNHLFRHMLDHADACEIIHEGN